jgi:hypothetical protein
MAFSEDYLDLSSEQIFSQARVLRVMKISTTNRAMFTGYEQALIDLCVELTGYTPEICRERIGVANGP